MSLFLALVLNFEIALSNSNCLVYLYKWINIGYFSIDISFYFDSLTTVMLFVVCFISSLVHIYSIEYMRYDLNFIRFMSYLSLFTFFMLILVTSDNFVQMFIGWEGVGLSSYLLISFWYTRYLANKAAVKAMLVNRIGDLSLLVGISILYFFFGTLKYSVIFSLVVYFLNYNFYFLGFEFHLISIICFFLFVGAMGKSAQLGLHIWLPDAMEGPTPVSALIHAATMVTAGVFLVIRCSFIFEYTSNILIFVGLVGSLTCFFSSIIGAFQFDIKKIVAYSTCSQLGYMFFSCGMSNYHVGLFHLFNHAFFKALLFLSMGSIIHALSDEQDFRRMGGLLNLLPITYVMVFVGSLSLLAMPFLTGYYSKDMILEFTYASYNIRSFFFFLLGILAAFFTAFYSARLIYWVFLAPVNFYRSILSNIHEPGFFMIFPMILLFFFSIFIGYISNEAFIGIGSLFLGNSIYIFFCNYSTFDAEFSLYFIKYVPLFISFFGIVIFFFSIYYYKLLIKIFFKFKFFRIIYKFFSRAFYFDLLMVDYLFYNFLRVSYLYIYKYIEKGIFEFYIAIFLKFMLNKLNNLFNIIRSGYIFYYFFFFVFFFVFFNFFFFMLHYLFFYQVLLLFFISGFFVMSNKIIII